MPAQTLTPQQAADLLGIHVDTLKAAADRGDIPCWRTPGGHRRFDAATIRRILTDREQEAAS